MKTLLCTSLLIASAALFAEQPSPLSYHLSLVTVMVSDQNEALRYYTEVLGMEKRRDMRDANMRFLTVAPKGQTAPEIVLLLADKPRKARVGEGATWALDTDDCRKTYEVLKSRGVKFLGPPQEQPWGGIQAVFEDLYGNPFALIQRTAERRQ